MAYIAALVGLAASAGCTASTDGPHGPSEQGENQLLPQKPDNQEDDPNRPPQKIRIPVRFTKNDVTDVGTAFTSSWVPFTGVSKQKMDGSTWALSGFNDAAAAWYAPDHPGAGYATAYFIVTIGYRKDGTINYPHPRVRLESEFLLTRMATSTFKQYSPLRIRAGSDQPCLSIMMSGSLEGLLKTVPLPYTDEGFTGHAWHIGDRDSQGVPITKVVLGGLRFSAGCYPENVEGKTTASGGVGIPYGAFVMVDKQPGQGGSDSAAIAVNLVENEKGVITLGAAYTSNAAILNEPSLAEFNAAAATFGKTFKADYERTERCLIFKDCR